MSFKLTPRQNKIACMTKVSFLPSFLILSLSTNLCPPCCTHMNQQVYRSIIPMMMEIQPALQHNDARPKQLQTAAQTHPCRHTLTDPTSSCQRKTSWGWATLSFLTGSFSCCQFIYLLCCSHQIHLSTKVMIVMFFYIINNKEEQK